MDVDEAEMHSKFVRLDVAAIVLILFIAAIVTGWQMNIGYGLTLATLGFALVGFSVARAWHNELAENDVVELDPLMGILTGGIMIAILQSISGYFVLDLQIILALCYGLAAGLGYDIITFGIAFFNLPGEEYKTRTHPQKNDGKRYVFEDMYYIGLIEEEALKNAPDN